MSEQEPSFKPNAKVIASDIYKEVAKWLLDLAKPLITTAAVALGVFIAGQVTVFGAFLTTDLKLNRYQLFLWILLGAAIGLCVAAFYIGKRVKRRADIAERQHASLLQAAEQRAEQAEAMARAQIAELEKRTLSAEEIAARDPLTGLFNLRELERRVQREIAEAYENKLPLSMILMDIDGFGETNQKYGYPAGDAILKQFAQALIEGSRRKDPFFRYRSGDEFAVLALNQGQDGAHAFAKRICRETRESEFEVRDQKKNLHFVKITISAGIAEIAFPRGGTPNFEEVARNLEAQAQAALSEAKRHKDRAMTFAVLTVPGTT